MKLTIGVKDNGAAFSLPLDLVTQSLAILAKRGSGKSYTAAVFTEELLEAGQQVVVIDPTGSAWGIKSSADGNSPGYEVVVFGGDNADLPLEETSGKVLARAVVEHRFSCVLDLNLFRKGAALRFLTDFLETLYLLNRQPIHIVCDEADYYAPQKPFGEEARALGAMQDIVRRGRRKGIGCTLISQRPSVLNKDVLTQCEVLVALRLVHPRDIDAIEAWVAVHGEPSKAVTMIESLPPLEIGTAWFWSPGWGDIFERVRIRKRRTFDSGATPKAGETLKAPKRRAEIDLEKLGAEIKATAERAKESDPRALHAKIASLEKQLREKEPEVIFQKVPFIPDHVLKIISAVNDQADTLARLAKALKIDAGKKQDESGEELTYKLKHIPTAPHIIRPADFKLPRPPSSSESRPDGTLPKGERATLIACAQYPDGVTREQLTVLTGYKRSSRDAYVQRLKEKGFVEVNANGVFSTADGLSALGEFEPLPTGDALREYWMNRLPEGERRVLDVLVESYPDPVERSKIDEVTGYQRSSRDAYLQRMKAKRLVEITGAGHVRASHELFSF